MPRKRQKFFEDKEKGIYKARFYGLGNVKNPPQRTLCTVDEVLYRDPINKKGRRTKQAAIKYLEKLWEKTFQELSREKKQEEKKREQEKKPNSIYWLFDQFLSSMKSMVRLGQRDQNTLDKYTYAIRYYKQTHRDHLIERRYFNSNRVSQFLATMQKSGCSDRSIWNYCISIKSVLNWGYEQFDEDDERYVKDLIKFKLPPKPKTQPVLYTTDEVTFLENDILEDYRERLKKLREAKKAGRPVARKGKELLGVFLLYKTVFLIKNTGMRKGEVLHLPYEHINLDRGQIEITDVVVRKRKRVKNRIEIQEEIWSPKGNKSRRVIDISKNKGLMDFLKYDMSIKPDEERYFLGDGTGILYFGEPKNLWRAGKKRVEKLGINGVKPFHSLRGWAITYLLSQGHPIPMVQDMVGHEDPATTIGYWNLMKNSSSDLVGQL